MSVHLKHGTTNSPANRSLLVGAVLATLFCGCATYPFSKSIRDQAKPVTMAEVKAAPAEHTGSVVIWGGRVLQAVGSTNGSSLYVLKLPLKSSGEPDPYGVAAGRFIAQAKQFLDPELFTNGRLVTVAGEITGVKTEPLEHTQYTYPVVAIRELHSWPLAQPRYYYYSPYWYYGDYGAPGWYWGWYGPGWAWGWYGPHW